MNPFKENGYLLPVASINSVYVDDIPAYDLFRPALIIQKLEENRDILGIKPDISGNALLYEFNNILSSDIPSIKEEGLKIANEFGDNLAKVLATLKKPSELAIKNRNNWNKEHWDHWKTIRKIYLVGGLTSPLLTRVFMSRIKEYFKRLGIDDLKISFIEGSSNLGTKGLSTLVEHGEVLLFDFGQTNIKREHLIKEQNETSIDNVLPEVKSDYLFYKHRDDDELMLTAQLLDKYITEVIVKTCNEVGFKGLKIHMAIANYVNDGKIYPNRGGYGKLALIADNYQTYLSEKVSDILCRKIEIVLHHDTSSMALNFKNKHNTAVISLGTAFGVAFI